MNTINSLELETTLCQHLKRAIADEYLAGQLYVLWALAVKTDEKCAIFDLFTTLAAEKTHKHMMELIEWCRNTECDIPCTEAELKKFSSSYVKKLLSSMKKNKDSGYYLEQAIKLEQESILSYRKLIEHNQIEQFTDLQSILWNIYYDEEEHLRKIKSALLGYHANVDMLIA